VSGKRRKYTPEFREQAARLVIETGRPVAHVAAETGVGGQVLGRWVRLAREAAAAADTGAVLDAAGLLNVAGTLRRFGFRRTPDA
jgi:transposase